MLKDLEEKKIKNLLEELKKCSNFNKAHFFLARNLNYIVSDTDQISENFVSNFEMTYNADKILSSEKKSALNDIRKILPKK